MATDRGTDVPMPLLKGAYKVDGASLDDDPVRFSPDDPGEWGLLGGRKVRGNRAGDAQLRLDGIDTLEPRYRPPRGPELHQPAKVEGRPTPADSAVLLPQLFRRLADYLQLNDGDPSLDGFRAYLEQRDDGLFVLSFGQWIGVDTVAEVTNGNALGLHRLPEDLVFDEK